MGRFIIKFLAAFALFLSALILLAVIGVHVYLKTDQAGRWIKEKVNASIPGHIEWDQVDISLLKGKLDVKDAMIEDPEGQPVIAAQRLFIDISLLGMFGGNLTIESAQLAHPRVLLETDREGRLNLARAFSAPGRKTPAPETRSEFPFNIFVDDLEITDGTFKYQAEPNASGQAPQFVVLEQIDLRIGHADLAGRTGRIDAAVKAGAFKMAGMETRLEQFEFKTELDRGRLEPILLNIRTTGPNLKLTGSVSSVFDQPFLNVDLDLAADLDLVQKLFAPSTRLPVPSGSGLPCRVIRTIQKRNWMPITAAAAWRAFCLPARS